MIAALRLLLCLMCAALAAAGPAHAQATNSDGSATVEVYSPFVLTKERDLDFGNIIVPGTGNGWVRINPGQPDGSEIQVNGPFTTFGTAHSARFNFIAPTDGRVVIRRPPGRRFLTRVGGTERMRIRRWRLDRRARVRVQQGDLVTFEVGATINVGTNQAEGLYEAEFPITVEYL